MNKMNVKLNVLMILFGLSALTACGGSTTANVNPMDLFDSSNSVSSLDAIIPSTSSFTTLVQGFSASSPRWIFSAGSFYGGSYLAPAAGIVTDVGTATISGSSVTYVRIMHSGQLSTIVYGVQLPNVRPGDGVVSGQIIGNFVSSGNAGFEVRLRDVPVCPLSYVSAAFRQTVSTIYTQLCI